jgi:hypothetical protein
MPAGNGVARDPVRRRRRGFKSALSKIVSHHKEGRMTLAPRVAFLLTMMTLVTTPALSAPLGPAGAMPLKRSVELIMPTESIRYVRHRRGSAIPGAIIGGLLSGVVGGALGGGCYFNDCGYDYSDGGYSGGGYGGGGGFRGGHGGGGGGFRGGHGGGGHGGGARGHAGGGHRGGGGRKH